MLRRQWMKASASMAVGLGLTAALLVTAPAQAQAIAADAFVRQLSEDVLSAAKSDGSIRNGDVAKVRQLVDTKVMPHVDFERMTGMSVGPMWRQATPEQKQRMFEEFKTLMINTYSGALTQVKNQDVVVKPLRASGDDVVVRSEVRGGGDPIQLDYRLQKDGNGWKIYDVNVAGFWLVQAYQGQFKRDLSNGGLDKLIGSLAEKNKAAATKG